MRDDKKCQYCRRVYRGDGYKDACTDYCWRKADYSIRTGKPVRLLKPANHTKDQTYRKKSCKESMTRQTKVDDKPRWKVREILKKKDFMPKLWCGKQYKAVRG